jgi:hypothetical protein
MYRPSNKKDDRISQYFSRDQFDVHISSRNPFNERSITPNGFGRKLQSHLEKTQGKDGRKLMTEIRDSLNFRKSQVSRLV